MNVTGFTVGNTYFFRVFSYNNGTDQGTFDVCVTSPCTNSYCPTTYPSGVEAITNVTFAGINNTTEANATGGNHQYFCSPTATVDVGNSYTISVNGDTNGNYTNIVTAYFDWDQNGVFGAGEGYTIGSLFANNGTGTPAVNVINVPPTATLGTTTMRITKKWNSAAAACNTGGYGQTEDYIVNVQSSLPCIQPTNQPTALTFSSITDTSISGSFTAATSTPVI